MHWLFFLIIFSILSGVYVFYFDHDLKVKSCSLRKAYGKPTRTICMSRGPTSVNVPQNISTVNDATIRFWNERSKYFGHTLNNEVYMSRLGQYRKPNQDYKFHKPGICG